MATKAKVGAIFARNYRLEQAVGGNPFAPMWLARDVKSDARLALKIIPATHVKLAESLPALNDAVARFHDVDHPNLCVEDGVVADGTDVAVVRQWIDGMSLAHAQAMLPAKRFEVREIKNLVFVLGEALESLHAKRLVHGDLKPTNVFIDSSGALRVADMARGDWLTMQMLRAGGRLAAAVTTPYLSAAQARGEMPLPADDVYAYGVMIYELLTGRPPFFDQKFRRKIASRVPPPMMDRRKDFGVTGEPIPLAWEQAVSACLARDAYARPVGFAAVLKMLGRPEAARVTSDSTDETASASQPETKSFETPEPVAAMTEKPREDASPIEAHGHENLAAETAPAAGAETRFEWASSSAPSVVVSAGSRTTHAPTASADHVQPRVDEATRPASARRQRSDRSSQEPSSTGKGSPIGVLASARTQSDSEDFLSHPGSQEAPISALVPGWVASSGASGGVSTFNPRNHHEPRWRWDVVLLRGLTTLVMLAVAASGAWYGWQFFQTRQALTDIEARLARFPAEPSDSQVAGIDEQFAAMSPTWMPGRQRAARELWNRRKAAISEHHAAAQPGGIAVRPTPADAQVQIGDRAPQRGPVELRDLPPGQYEVAIEREGYGTKHQTIEVKPNESTSVDVKLERLAGSLRLESNPPGASFEVVDLSGREAPRRGTTPTSLQLPTGNYRATFTRDGFPPEEKTVDVVADTVVTTTGAFPEGELAITQLGDAIATVVVDDVERGKSPTRVRLPAGAHNLKLKFADGRVDEQQVTIQPDLTRIVAAEMPAATPAPEPAPAETPIVVTAPPANPPPTISPPTIASGNEEKEPANSAPATSATPTAADPEANANAGAVTPAVQPPPASIVQRDPEPSPAPSPQMEPAEKIEPEPTRVANAPSSPKPPSETSTAPSVPVSPPTPTDRAPAASGPAVASANYDRVFELSEVNVRPVLMEREAPALPSKVLRSINGGRVELAFVLDRNGSPAFVTVQSTTDKRLNEPSLAAARLWRFSPARKDGHPVSVRVVVPVVFPQTQQR